MKKRKKIADKKAAQNKTADQHAIAQKIQTALSADGININLYLIEKVMQSDQKICTELLAGGTKVVKWNYLTMYTGTMPPRKLKCPKDGKTYDVPENVRVNVRVGADLRKAVQKLAANTPPADKKRPQAQRKGPEKDRLYAERFVQRGAQNGQQAAGAAGVAE